MEENKAGKYDLENLTISEKTRKGLTEENINYIGAVGRMLSLQDLTTEETIGEAIKAQTKLMLESITKQNEIIAQQNKIIIKIQRLIFDIQEELKNHEVRLKKLEVRVDKMFLEHRLNHPI